MTNKKTGFWIRFLSRIMDLVFVSTIAVAIAFAVMDHGSSWTFKEDYLFYIWAAIVILILFVWFIVIPFIWNGKTLFMWFFRIKIIFKDENKIKSIITRELFFSVSWMFIMLLLMTIINHTLIIKYATTNQDNINYSSSELIRVGIITSISSVMMILQFIYSISIFVRGAKKGLHDSQSNTWTVWNNKFVGKDIQQEDEIRIVPKPINNNPVEWVE